MTSTRPDRPAGIPGPLPPGWQSISVQPQSLMKLRETINLQFKAGTIVALSNEVRVEQSSVSTPTKYLGQDQPNLNASTRVRVYRWYQHTSVESHPSRDGGKPFSIQHKHLVDPINGKKKTDRGSWKPDQKVKLNAEQGVSYITEKYPLLDPHGVALSIPNGTVGVVAKCMTRTNRPITLQQQESSNRTDWWYVVDVNVRRTQWVWLPCREYISVFALEPVTPQEEEYTNNLVRSTMGPPQLNVV